MALNSVNIMGNLVADPEIHQTSAKTSVTNARIACQKNYKNNDGEYDADFFNVVAFGNTAEFITKYFSKGESIIINGSLATNEWEDKEGNKHRDVNIVANSVYFGMKKPQDAKKGYKKK